MPIGEDYELPDLPSFGGGRERESRDRGRGDPDVTENREHLFNLESGRFHDADTGRFEAGSPPPDYAPRADRYRAKDGTFKTRSTDLFDEIDEVRKNSLEPRG